MMPRYETDAWPYMEAKFFGVKRTGTVRLIVIHDMEFQEKITAAEDVARYFQAPDPGTKPSAHICVDSDSIIQCVKDSYVANAAPGCNHDGIQVELAGYGSQSPGQWRDKYSLALLAIAADAVGQYCLKYDIPPIHLTNEQLKAGARGIIGHAQASAVYKLSDHTDPGPNFPWAQFIANVQFAVNGRRVAA
jgi:hypothetical protein